MKKDGVAWATAFKRIYFLPRDRSFQIQTVFDIFENRLLIELAI